MSSIAPASRPLVAVIVNRTSRLGRKDPSLPQKLDRVVGAHGYVRGTKSEVDLLAAIDEVRDRGVGTVALVGGDGSARLALTRLEERFGRAGYLPELALLGGGTMGTIARAVGAGDGDGDGGSVEARLARLVAALIGQRPLIRLPWLSLGVRADDGPRQLGFLFGVGVGPAFLAEYYGRSKQPSPLTAARTLGRMVGSTLWSGRTAKRTTEPVGVALSVTRVGRTTELPMREVLAIFAGTVPEVGLGFRPFFHASARARSFHLLAIEPDPLRLALRLHRAFRGRPLGEDVGRDYPCDRAVLTFARRGQRFFIDGDLFDADAHVSLELGPVVVLARG